FMKALGDNEVRIEYQGESVRRVMYLTYVLSGGLAGLAGVLAAFAVGHIVPEYAYWAQSGEFVFVALLGGYGSVPGPLIGSIAFEFLRTYASKYMPEAWQATLGVIMITGYLTPDRGRIEFMGRETTGLPPRAVTKLGIARSFQVPQLYTGLSVLENMLLSLAAGSTGGSSMWHPLYQAPRVAEGVEILERFGLGSYADRPVGQLAEGGRKLLDIALSFALRPRLLLMDEP